MDNEAIIRRLPHARFELTGKLDDIETMTEELANVPPGNDRANQIKQQMHSKVGDVRRVLDDLQPEPKKDESVRAEVQGEGLAPSANDSGSDEVNPDQHRKPVGFNDSFGGTDVTGDQQSGSGAVASDKPEVVEMEKEVRGTLVTVTVWASSAQHLEADGWTKVDEPREVEDGDDPVKAEGDDTDHGDGDHTGVEGHAGGASDEEVLA